MSKIILIEVYGKGVVRATDATKKQNEPTPYALESLAGYVKHKFPQNQVNIIQQRSFKKKDIGLPYKNEDESINVDDGAVLEIVKEIAKSAETAEPIIVGIREVAPTHIRAIEIAQMLKKVLPEIKIVVGGYHASEAMTKIYDGEVYKTAEKEMQKSAGSKKNLFDCIAVGEGEETLCKIIGAFEKSLDNSVLRGVEGVAYYDNEQNKGIFNGRRERMGMQEGRLKLPPAYRFLTTPIKDNAGRLIEQPSSIGSTQYFSYPEGKKIRAMQIQYHRGCAGCGDSPCSFCSSPNIWGPDVAFREPKDVVDEIAACHADPNMRANFVYFPDLTFNGNLYEFMRFLREMERRPEIFGDVDMEKVHWFSLAKYFNVEEIEKADAKLLETEKTDGIERIREIFQRMSKAGCSKIGIGIEGFTPEAMSDLKRSSLDQKQVKVDQEKALELSANAILSLKLASEAGMITRSFFLLGTKDQGMKFKEFSKVLLSLEIPNHIFQDFEKLKDTIRIIYACYNSDEILAEKDGWRTMLEKIYSHLGFDNTEEKSRLFEIDHLRLAPITPYYSTDTGREAKLRMPDYYRDDGENGTQKYLRDANNRLIPRRELKENGIDLEMKLEDGEAKYGFLENGRFKYLSQEELRATRIKQFTHPNFPNGLTLKEAIDAGMDWMTELLDQDNPILESEIELEELMDFAKRELIEHHYGNEAFKRSAQEKIRKFPHLRGSYCEWMEKVNKSLFKEGQEGFDWEITEDRENRENEREIKQNFEFEKLK